MSGFYLDPICSSQHGIPLPEFRGYTCGRQRTNDIMLNSIAVSRNHCTFTVSQNHFQVYDLQSANGTYVDGKRIPSKMFCTVPLYHTIGLSSHKTNADEFEENEKRFVYRLTRLPPNYSKNKSETNNGNFTKEEVGEKRKLNGESSVPFKIPRLENVEDGYVSDDDCIMIEDPLPRIRPEPDLAVGNSSNLLAPQVAQENNLIKYELDILEDGSASEATIEINNRPAANNSAQNSTLNPTTNGSLSRVEELSSIARSSSSTMLNDETNSNDIFSESPVSSPKNADKNIKVESGLVKQEPRVSTTTNEAVDVIQIDDDDVVVFPASQLFDDEEVNETSTNDDGNCVENVPVSSIIKEECDLGTDNINCYNDLESEEAEESEYPVIVLSDDDDEHDTAMNPWFLKLSGSQLESRSSSELEELKLKEEPKEEMDDVDHVDDNEDELVNGFLDSIEVSDFVIDNEEAQVPDEVTAQDAMITDETEAKKKAIKLAKDIADAVVANLVNKTDVKKMKKDKKNKMLEDRRKENQSKPREKSKTRKSEKNSSSKIPTVTEQPIDTYEYRSSFEEPAIQAYQSTRQDPEIKKKKGIIIRSNIEIKTPIVRSIVTDKVLPGPSNDCRVDKVEKKLERNDGKDERKDKGAVKNQKDGQKGSKGEEKIEEKLKRVEKDKIKDKKDKKKKKKEKTMCKLFEEALMASNKGSSDDKKIKKKKHSQESGGKPQRKESADSEPVASTSAEVPAKKSSKVDAETKTLVIDGKRVSISSKVEKKIKTIDPPIFTRGGRHGVSASLSAALNNTPAASNEPDPSRSNDSENPEEDYNSDLFSKPKKLSSSSKFNNAMEKQKLRLTKAFREREICKGAGALRKAISKRENRELYQDRRERLKQLAENKKKVNTGEVAAKRINKPRAKISKNRGMFLVPEDANLDTSRDDEAAVKINNGPSFDLHVEVIKTNHMNANPTAVDDLFDVISTRSCPGYAEPPPQDDKDTESDSSFDYDNVTEVSLGANMNIDDNLMDYTDTETVINEPTTSSSPDNYSPPKVSYSRPVREVSSTTCAVNQVHLEPSTVAHPPNASYYRSSRPVKPIRGILKKMPVRGQANYVPNGIASHNLPQIGKPKKKLSFAITPPTVHLIDLLPGNKLTRKCIQKDAAMPKVDMKSMLPGDPSTYLPDLSTVATPKKILAPPSAPAPSHNVLTPRHNNIAANKYAEPRRISGPQLDEFLLRIFDWNPQWLDPKAHDLKSQKNLPIVPEGQIPHLSTYDNYNDYYSIMSDLMMLEMWAGIVREANDKECMKKRRNMHAVISQNSITQTPIRSTNHTLTVFTADILCDKTQIDNKMHANLGDLVMLELPIVVDNQIHFRPIFVYVKDCQKTIITPSSTFYNRCLKNTVPNPYAVVTLTMATKSLPLNIKFDRVLRMKTRFYMRPNLRMVQAIQHLPSNPLLYHIIQPNPKKDVYVVPKAHNYETYNFATGDVLNDKQKETVLSITNAVVHSTPKICLVEGPPGTGKSRVIVNIITEIIYGQERYENKDRRRILVCAPSNAAIDEITMRLMDIRAKFKKENKREPFRLLRVGNAKSMHPRVHEISLSELVNRTWDSSGPGDVSAEREINRLNHQISELKLTMETIENMPEGERIKLKMKLEDWITQLAFLQNSKQTRHQNSEKRFHLENKLLSNADIITCTLSSCYSQPMELAFGNRSSKKISVCIVDEATQSTEPETLIPLMLGVHKLVLVGDPQQLPATVLSSKAKELKYDKSLFARIYDLFGTELEENPVMSLNTQYRMAHAIVYWPNRFFYNNLLQSDVKRMSWPYSPYKVFNLTSVQDNNPYSNSDEATFVVNLIHTIVMNANLDNIEGIVRIGVITPYQDQRKLISSKLRDKFATVPDNIKNRFIKEVSTVDGFQGQEREIIIMSCVRSNGIGFMSDRQRLCVALTRAKHSLFLCGNFKTFERDETWGALIKDARGRNFYINTDHRADHEKIKQNIINKRASIK